MPTVVRQIELHDVPAFRACLDSVARERKYLAQVEAPPLERVKSFVAESVANDAVQFVAIEGGELIGWCDVFPHWAYALQHVGTLGMGVREGYRGRGVGEQLLRRTLDHAVKKGIYRVTLEARADNLRAIRLYERFGFVHEGMARAALRFEGCFYDGVNMALLLGPASAA